MNRLLLIVPLVLLCGPCSAEEHVWSKHGSSYPLIVANEAVGRAQPIDVFSPDHRKHLHIEWKKTSSSGDASAVLTIVVDSARYEVLSNKDCNQVEVLWSRSSGNIAR